MSSNLLSFLYDLFDKLNFIKFIDIDNISIIDNYHIIIPPYWTIFINHKPYLPYDTILFSIQYNNDTISIYQNSNSLFLKCEHFIKVANEVWSSMGRINSNPNWRQFTNKLVQWNNIRSNSNNIIFIYTDEIPIHFSKIINVLNNSSSKFILISSNSDYPINHSYYNIIHHPNLHRWYGIDCNLNDHERHNKVIPIPIGIQNLMDINYTNNGYLAEFNRVIYEVENGDIQKTNNIFFNFTIHTNKHAREDCYHKLKNHIEWIPLMPYLSFIRHFATYKFCICPVGNGLDTHRVWDCMYLRIIPIMLRNKYSEYWEHKIPCILLNDWTDLINIINDMDKMLEFMENQWTEDNIYKMKYWNFAYYKDIIQNDFQSIF
jgi:hypothetical protein